MFILVDLSEHLFDTFPSSKVNLQLGDVVGNFACLPQTENKRRLDRMLHHGHPIRAGEQASELLNLAIVIIVVDRLHRRAATALVLHDERGDVVQTPLVLIVIDAEPLAQM